MARQRLMAVLAKKLPAAAWLAIGVALGSVGCQQAVDQTADQAALVAEHRDRLTLAEEPEGAVSPLDLLEQEGGFSEGDVVLVGQIGGVPNPFAETEPAFPWKDGLAVFYLVDPSAVAESADHPSDDPDHAENCPFCARNAANNAKATAQVSFGGDQPIALGAQDLLALKENQLVVVRGRARLVGEQLQVDANGVYVRE